MKLIHCFLLSLAIVLLDQGFKLWVYFHYQEWPLNLYGDHELPVLGEWFRLHYLLNEGMAFGIRWKSEFGKLALTMFRLAAMSGIIYYLVKSIRQRAHIGFLISLSLILGGAVGNVVDSTFYGVFLHNAPPDSPTPWFHGQVIDMLFFPLFDFNFPSWVPFFSNQHFLFFSPVFNIADSSIFVGVVLILLFQKKFFPLHHQPVEVTENPTAPEQSEASPF